MKKIFYVAIILALCMLLFASCKSEETTQPAATPAANTGAATPTVPAAQTQTLPKDVYKLGATDLATPIAISFTIDNNDVGIVKSVRFDIRNAGKEAIKPVVILIIGDAEGSEIKRFDYDELPSGYKMIKEEQVNMVVPTLVDPVFIKADLRDKLQSEKVIGTDSKSYLAKPVQE